MGRTAVVGRDRWPNGRLKPETAPPALVKRIVDDAKRGAADPRLGSVLGHYRLTDVLSDREFSAGDLFAKIVAVHDRLKGLPKRSARSPSFEIGYGSSVYSDIADDDAIAALAMAGGRKSLAAFDNLNVAAVLSAERRLRRAENAVISAIGRAGLRLVSAVCVEDRRVLPTDHAALKSGLAAIADAFDLTARGRR